MKTVNIKKAILPNLPYAFIALYATKLGQAARLSPGADFSAKALHIMEGFAAAFQSALPSFHPIDLCVGVAAALLIRLESPGPVIYRQDRVGLYEKEFTVYKFRSMRTDAEKNGAVWAAANDARVTRVGKFIRKVRIDELPQIWNIIKGDMSFIGPRPERMTFVKQLKEHIPYYSLRHTVKPGLTGWAQVCYPYGANEEDARHKLEYDLFYVKNISILLDIHIIFKTVGVVLFPKGAR